MTQLIDLEKVRSETPACHNVTHLNNAGSSLMPEPVYRVTADYLRSEYEIGGYETAAARAIDIERMYGSISSLLNCKPQEIAFAESATRAWEYGVYSQQLKAGDRVLCASTEYGSNYIALLQLQKRLGIQVEVIPDEEDGTVSLSGLQNMLDDRVKIVSITHVPATSGRINPIVEIGKIVGESSALYVVDATQSVGHLPVDVTAVGCDILVATGRKFLRGPRGTGFLFMRESRIEETEPIFLETRSTEMLGPNEYIIRPGARRFEAFEYNFAGKVGLGMAAEYALSIGIEAIATRVKLLSQHLVDCLRAIPKVQVLEPANYASSGIISFAVPEFEAQTVCSRMRQRKVNLCCMELNDAPISFELNGFDEFLRASPHYFNTKEEIQTLCEDLERM